MKGAPPETQIEKCTHPTKPYLASVMSLPLLYSKTIGNGCDQLKCPSLLSHFFSYIIGLYSRINALKNSNHMLTCIIVIFAMLTLCYSIMSHVSLILYYYASMLTLQTSLISYALWLPHASYFGG